MKYCHIKGCVATKREDVTYFRIPIRPEIRTKWIEAIAKHQEFDFSNDSFMICELHFDGKELLRSQTNDLSLKRGAVPSKFPSIYIDDSQSNTENVTNEQVPQIITQETSEEESLLIPKCTKSPIGSPRSIKIEKGTEAPITATRATSQRPSRAAKTNASIARRLAVTKSTLNKRTPTPKSMKITAKPMRITQSPARITAKTPTVTTTLGKKTASGRVPKMSRRLQESNYFVKPIKQEKTNDLPSIQSNNANIQRSSKPSQNASAVRKPNATPVTKRTIVTQIPNKSAISTVRPTSSLAKTVSTSTHVTPHRVAPTISSPMPSPILSQSPPQSQPQSIFAKVPTVSTDTVTISRSFWVKLTKTSTELHKASQKISQLEASIQDKDREIKKLQEMLQSYKRNATNQCIVKNQPTFLSPANKRKRDES